MACNVKSKPFKGTSALAVVIICPIILEILFFGENFSKSIPLGMTEIFFIDTLKSFAISFFEL